MPTPPHPEIMAPAGSQASFLAALAAGADAVYCGLKTFSARMKAENFSLETLTPLTELAHRRGIRVYVTMNTLLKPDELQAAGEQIEQLSRYVQPDALIFSDLAVLELARSTGFAGELHLSTLANLSHPDGLKTAAHMGIHRVVLPRELSIEELKTMARHTPPALGLEVFVYGALCYGVSGRCYWSSWFGGKSGLRGQCVQPCRRAYHQEGRSDRFFSCQDFNAAAAVDQLLEIPELRAWKIEGRKKGPHYVYHTVKAFKLLRDEGSDPAKRQQALELLDQALGRTATPFHLFPQPAENPTAAQRQTGSGQLIGALTTLKRRLILQPRIPLIPGDLLRVGYEDTPGHCLVKIRQTVKSMEPLPIHPGKGTMPALETPVFLIDRREPELERAMAELETLRAEITIPTLRPPAFRLAELRGHHGKTNSGPSTSLTIRVERKPPRRQERIEAEACGLWLTAKLTRSIPSRFWKTYHWWLPPIIWPPAADRLRSLIRQMLQKEVREWVLNDIWQIGLFPEELRHPKTRIWAGPFCNPANAQALKRLADFGFSGAVVSPELSLQDYRRLPQQSPLPLGIVLSANWPLCLSRIPPSSLQTEKVFTSPQGENSWMSILDDNYYLYPNWPLDLSAQRRELEKAGYRRFFHLPEPVPKGISLRHRPGQWNWQLQLQ